MAPAPDKWIHPAFGPCEAVPSLIAIKWKAPLDRKAADSALKSLAVRRATERPQGMRADAGRRDPRAVNVNQNTHLTWATSKNGSDELERIGADDRVLWVA